MLSRLLARIISFARIDLTTGNPPYVNYQKYELTLAVLNAFPENLQAVSTDILRQNFRIFQSSFSKEHLRTAFSVITRLLSFQVNEHHAYSGFNRF